MFLEAIFTGIKEGTKLSVCIFLVVSYFGSIDGGYMKRPLHYGLAAVFISSLGVMTVHITPEVRDCIVKLMGYVFGIFFLLSLASLYHMTGTDLLGPLKGAVRKRYVTIPLVFVLTLLYFVPDMVGSSIYLGDLYAMSGNKLRTFLYAITGFVLSPLFSYFIFKKIRWDATKLFGFPQLLLALALVKLCAGGVRGFAGFSLVPSVRSGLMKLIHDVVHQTLITVMAPDHPLLSTTTWNFIGFIFRETAAMWLSLIILLLPLLIFLGKHFAAGIETPPELPSRASKRKFIKSVKDERVLKALPIIVFILFIMGTWFAERGESTSRLYNPEPVPVVAEGDKAILPINGPGTDLRDGMMHKYTVEIGSDTIRLFVMRKNDGSMSVCLDACEICPPDGYVQGEDHVICVYCMTPIAIDTLGRKGGCNPVPLNFHVEDGSIVIELSEMKEKWERVTSGATKDKLTK